MESQENFEKFSKLEDSLEWSARAKISGQRVLDSYAKYSEAISRLGEWVDPEMQIAIDYFDMSRVMRAEVYFFTLAFTNYLKSLDLLRMNINLEKLKGRRDLLRALRNIFEHWDKHSLRDFSSGEINEKSMKNYQIFLRKFPHSPAVPFEIAYSHDGDVTIASIIEIRKTIALLERNEVAIQKYISELLPAINPTF